MSAARDASFGITIAFAKSSDNTGSMVRGWASVATVDGVPVVDFENDTVTINELTKAAHRFITDARISKMMHNGHQIGAVVESVIIDDDFARAVGMTDTKRGWWIGVAVTDEDVKKRVRSGELAAFSIGGRGQRVPAAA